MSEVPDFSEFITESDRKYFDYLDRHWLQLPFESYRISFSQTVIAREMAITEYFNSRQSLSSKARLNEKNDVMLSHFLYYMDALFDTPPERTDRAHYLVEAFRIADLSQERLNSEGELLYQPVALQTKIEEILLADTDEKAKQDIVDIFQTDIYETVRRRIG